MQPSSQKIDGRKLFVLIGKNGGTVAYLDIPPGLDPEPGARTQRSESEESPTTTKNCNRD